MSAFVYTEMQVTLPFNDAPWQAINTAIKQQPGFINKTWLSGDQSQSVGGIYTFDSIENAQKFVTGYFPSEARQLGLAQRTLIFNGDKTHEASQAMKSPHAGHELPQKAGAYVYTEVQLNVPFADAPWRDLETVLKSQPGFLSKTWLSGLHTNTLGGFYAFDTLENARQFAIEYFPTEAAALNAAFTTRVFDAEIVAEASRDMNSPFYK